MKKIKGLTESQILASIERVASQLAPAYVFGYYGVDDIKQECHLIAFDRLHKFDVARSNNSAASLEEKLDQFLYVVLDRRLRNLKRDKFSRLEHPCASCATGEPCEPGSCRPHREWVARNADKMSIMSPSRFQKDEAVYVKEEDAATKAGISEALNLIDEKLDVALREDYLKMRANVYVPPARRALIEETVKAILGDMLHE